MTASSLSRFLDVPETAGPDDVEDLDLVWRARSGCEDAFRALVERHQHRVHRFCFHFLRDDGDALEAAQDTFIRAYHALARFQPRAKFSTWLLRIALNRCRDQRRKRKPLTVDLGSEGFEPACARPGPDSAAIYQGDLAKLDRGLAALPERYRAILVMTCLDGLSHIECAEILRCSERAVEGRLYRARRRLADWWERDPSLEK